MGLYLKLHDTVTRMNRLISYPGFTDEVTTVTGSPQTNFDLTFALTASHKIDAWIDGRKQIDTIHFNRNISGQNRIEFTTAVEVGSVVEIRVYYK